MILEKKKLLGLVERWEKKAQNAEARYQESGDQRHLREKENAEDMADALRMAANAEEDYSELVLTRGRLADYQALGMTPAEIKALQRERDAAVKDLTALMGENLSATAFHCCKFCVFNGSLNCPLADEEECHPQWRGPQEDTKK